MNQHRAVNRHAHPNPPRPVFATWVINLTFALVFVIYLMLVLL